MNHELRIMGKIRTFVSIILASCFLLLASTPLAHAQSLSVSIDPSIVQVDAKGPSLIKTPLSIQNGSDQSITYGIFLVPFKAGNSGSGQPDFDNSLIEEYREIFKRVKIIDGDQIITQLTLAPGQKKDLTLSISVSKEEQSHDYYFSVVFVSQDSQQPRGNSSVTARGGIGANVLLSVGPKSSPEGIIEQFTAPTFVSGGPVDFKLRVKNNSNHFVTVKGNVIVKNIFGQVVGNMELLPVNVLSNSSRFMENDGSSDTNDPSVVWTEKFLLGIYKVEAEVALSDEGPLLKDSLVIYAFPIQAVLLVILSIVLLVGIVRRARSKTQD